MIKNLKAFLRFEDQFKATDRLSYTKSLGLFEGMWREAVSLGVLPPKDPMEGIEVDIQIAKIIHSCSKKY